MVGLKQYGVFSRSSRTPACSACGNKMSRLSYSHPSVCEIGGEIIGRLVPGEITTSATPQSKARSITSFMWSMLLRLILAPGLARFMSYPPALSDLTVAAQSCSRFFASERIFDDISSGQQCGELTGTSKTLYPLRVSSDMASMAVNVQR